jgi:hypothetical protein
MGTALDRLRPPSSREAIVNSLVAAKTMRGINDGTFSALLRHRLREVLGKYVWQLKGRGKMSLIRRIRAYISGFSLGYERLSPYSRRYAGEGMDRSV